MSRWLHVGIVGHESAKFTAVGEVKAREIIRFLLSPPNAVLVSGHCHLGGIDVWAEEEAIDLHRPASIWEPMVKSWESHQDAETGLWLSGYKARNLKIAEQSDIVHCIVVRELPDGYQKKNFAPGGCYHCLGRVEPHVKSGGCWTAWRAKDRQWWIL